jgi:hypothetical protein
VDRLDGLHSQLVRTVFSVRFFSAVILSAIAVAGCSPSGEQRELAAATPDAARADSIARARQDAINRATPGYVVDSILPIEEELRRFRLDAVGNVATKFRDGSGTREMLVKRFVRALVVLDSADLEAMLIDQREFADLVYPESPYTRPPYRQAPGLVWNQIQNPSRSGLTRLIRRLGGQPLQYEGHTCVAQPDRQGRNLIWTGCVVRLVDQNGDIRKHRLFGSIIERDGNFKFVSYVNEF